MMIGARVAEGTVSHFDPTWGWVWTEPDVRRLVAEAELRVGSISYDWIVGGGYLRMVRGTNPPLPDAGRHEEARPALVGAST